jgi:hypothetical protein
LTDRVHFHHDGFEYNDGARPPLDFDFEKRWARYSNGGPYVYLHRDPRDVIVSLHFQVTGRFADFFRYSGSLSDFIRDPYFGAENLQRFRAQWTRLCEAGLALPISYEACHADYAGTLAKVIAHYGFDVDESAIDAAAKESEFEKMRNVEKNGEFVEPWLQLRNGSPKVRRGKVGGYADELDPADIAYLDGVFGLIPRAEASGIER